MIKVKNLNKYYLKGKDNELHVINDCNLELPDTGLITILGESGSGKTTLLNVIGGLDSAKGTISYDDVTFNGYKMNKIDKYRKENIGYIFQNYNILPNYSVYENLRLALELINIIDKDEVDKRIKMALNAVGLYKFRKKPAGKLSGGQQQRVAIARALIKKCKLLIADEPTGNLDSTNSIEIMNILKKISENTLVLLVTHDKTLAEFYSEKIIELVDGKIVNIREANNSISLSDKNENKIYLKDMNTKSEGESIKTTVFSDKEIPDIDICLVYKNGTYYLKSNVKILPLSESKLELIDDHYKESTKEDYKNNLIYSNDDFSEEKKSRNLKRLFVLFKEELFKFFHVKKRTKLIRFVLIILGAVLGFLTINLIKYTYKDYSDCIGDKNVYELKNENKINDSEYKNALDKAIELDLIDAVSIYDRKGYSFTHTINNYVSKDYSANLPTVSYDACKESGIFAGREPKDKNEVVIGKKLARKLKKKLKVDKYEDLFNVIQFEEGSKKIVGITNKETTTIYTNDYGFNYTELKKFYIPSSMYDILYDGTIDYSLIDGELLDSNDEDSNNILLLVNDSSSNYLPSYSFSNHDDRYMLFDGESYYDDISLGKTLRIGSSTSYNKKLTIKGVVYSDDLSIKNSCSIITKNITILNELLEFGLNKYANFGSSPISKIDSNHKIVLGSEINKHNDIVVSINSKYNIGDKIGDMTVCGKASFNVYGANDNSLIDYYMSDLDYELDLGYNAFITSNPKKLIKVFNEYDIELINIRKNEIRVIDNSLRKSNLINLSIMGITLAIIIIYVYFTMRSKLIADIYEIGVLRNIGASKSRIYSKYVVEIAITTFFTTLIGYLIFVFIYGYIWDKVKSISAIIPQYSVLDSPYIYLGILFTFIINIFIGILPTILLLRKTPKEISSKYDI